MQQESKRKAPVTVIKMSERQGRDGDWGERVGGEKEGGGRHTHVEQPKVCVHTVYVCVCM